jgi:hypothetical protein
MLRRTRPILGSVAILLAACRSEQRVSPTRAEAEKWTAVRQVLDQPTPETPFNDQAFRAAPDGGAWCVTGNANPTVFSYDREGKMTVRGRPGRGPGEFGAISRMGFRGDTTWITDGGNNRVVFFDRDGKLVGTVRPIGVSGSLSEKGVLILEGILPDGSLLVRLWRTILAWESGGPYAILFRFPRTKLGKPGLLPSAERIDSTIFVRPSLRQAKNMDRIAQPPWDDSDLEDIAPNGTIIVDLTRVPEQSNRARTFHLRVQEGSRVITDTSIAYDAVPITDSLISEAWNAARADLGDVLKRWPSEMDARRDFEKALYRPQHLPPVRTLLVGNDSTIWLERPAASRNALWEVYDLHARLLGRFETPRAFQGLTASGTAIWGKELNEDGAWSIVRYRLTRRPQLSAISWFRRAT